jgi:quinol-cytochrome oxidoreductase complex cytochrome b subunit
MNQPTGQTRSFLTRGLLAASLIAATFAAFLLRPSSATASPDAQSTSTPSPLPTPTFNPRRLDKPPVSTPLDQVEKGSLLYWGICMACHGDRGQGLTDEWRDAYGVEDRDCWQSGCHDPHHPPWGFLIPKNKPIPGVAGAGKLSRFATAQQLHDYIKESMPWWKPASLSDEQAWQATAYILKMHSTMPEQIELGATNALAITVQHAVTAPGDDRPAVLILSGIIILAAAGWASQEFLSHKAWRQSRLAGAPISHHILVKPNFFHHLHPPTIPLRQARFRYTLGAGGLSVFLSLILLITGMLEMFYYIPVPERAAVSIQIITSLVPYGALIRNLHFWSAQALVVVIFIHLLRIVLTGAYARNRRLNYLIGLGMLALVLLLDFTGYVLRWDEGIRWALVVGTNLLKTIPLFGEPLYLLVVGGSQPGSTTIERFYSWHIFVLTLGMILLGAWHIFRTRRDGGIAVPPPALRKDQERITRGDLLRREVLAMLLAGVLLLLLSTLVPAPIEPPITQATTEVGNARAPWFFLWIQELLKLGDPFIWGVLFPACLLMLLAGLPYITSEAGESELGRWFPVGNRLAQLVVVAIVLLFFALTLASLLN